MQDQHRTGPTQETCAATTVDHTDGTGATRKHELDHAVSGIDNLSALKHLDGGSGSR